MYEQPSEQLNRVVKEFERKLKLEVRSLLSDFRIMHARLSQEERRLMADWIGEASLFKEDPTSIRMDITLQAKFSKASDSDKPRAISTAIFADKGTVDFRVKLPMWLDD